MAVTMIFSLQIFVNKNSQVGTLYILVFLLILLQLHVLFKLCTKKCIKLNSPQATVTHSCVIFIQYIFYLNLTTFIVKILLQQKRFRIVNVLLQFSFKNLYFVLFLIIFVVFIVIQKFNIIRMQSILFFHLISLTN